MTEAESGETFLQRQKRLKAEREALERGAVAWARKDDAQSALVDAGNVRAQRWVQSKVTAQIEELATRAEGDRNDFLNNVAYSMGRFVPKWLDYSEIGNKLYDAARACGLEHDESVATIKSGLTAGMDEPRDPPVDEPEGAAEPFADKSTGEVFEGAETPAAPEETTGEKVRRLLPQLDWHALWADEDVEDWILEPLLPARRLVAIYSPPKVGKSLLSLEMAVAISRASSVLGVDIDRPRHVLYVDFENDPKADIRARLQAMAVGPDDLTNLHYLSFPTLAALDSEAGSLELLAAVTEYECEVVVIDTVSRAVSGDENENDTWLSFYRHTGLKLKQGGIAMLRLDHSGKDESKGQRGGSAKGGDVDAVWRMSRVTDDTYQLECEMARMPIVEKVLVLHREHTPLRHRVDGKGRMAANEARVRKCIAELDALGLEDDTSVALAGEALRASGGKAINSVLAESVKARKRRSVFGAERGNED
jgi:hypothetical protein